MPSLLFGGLLLRLSSFAFLGDKRSASLLVTFGKQLSVLGSLSASIRAVSLLQSQQVSLALEGAGGDKALDLGGLGAGLLTLLLGELTTDDVLANIVGLLEGKELANLRGTLGTKTAGNVVVSQAGDLLLSTGNNDQVEDLNIGGNNATTNGLALALTSAAGAVALVVLAQKKTDTVGDKNSLHHRESLLIKAAGNAEDVALELISKIVAVDIGRDALIIKQAEFLLVVNLEDLLLTSGRIGNIQLGNQNWPGLKWITFIAP